VKSSALPTSRENNEAMAMRAYRLGARYATVAGSKPPKTKATSVAHSDKKSASKGVTKIDETNRPVGGLFSELLTENQNHKVARALGFKRISGQAPTELEPLMKAPQLRLHTSLFYLYLRAQPTEQHKSYSVVAAYEAYARVVADIDVDGHILNAQGGVIGVGGADRDHPAMPKLSLDRAWPFANLLLVTNNKLTTWEHCGSCKTPMLLTNAERPFSVRCALCKDRLNAGRPQTRRAA
jgi:LSD1 subclass zinc finger protein